MDRGAGTTTKQMQEAPKDAVFVWVNNHLAYPKDLARSLGRVDLKIVPPSWLRLENVDGRQFFGLVLDHAVVDILSDRQWQVFDVARARVR